MAHSASPALQMNLSGPHGPLKRFRFELLLGIEQVELWPITRKPLTSFLAEFLS
jgi:hypothetical protein